MKTEVENGKTEVEIDKSHMIANLLETDMLDETIEKTERTATQTQTQKIALHYIKKKLNPKTFDEFTLCPSQHPLSEEHQSPRYVRHCAARARSQIETRFPGPVSNWAENEPKGLYNS